jgi:hypothetical protein
MRVPLCPSCLCGEFLRKGLTPLALFACAACDQKGAAKPGAADLVFRHGAVYTVDAALTCYTTHHKVG